MKKVTINKVKVDVFEEDELKEKLELNKEQVDLILKYQRKFPELLQNKQGFCINGENLWEQLGKPQGEYGKWFERKIKSLFVENTDYLRFAKLVGTIKNNNGKEVSRHMLTVETAKHIALTSGADKNSSEEIRGIGRIVRNYFILMEETLRNYEKWESVREPEKQGFNEMKRHIHDWCIRRGCDPTIELFYSREADMLNENLIGKKARDIKGYIGYDDIITRNHLTTEVNQALYELQIFNINLLDANMSFEERSRLIKMTCDNRYSHLKLDKVS
jgi:phage anti-repressor protein